MGKRLQDQLTNVRNNESVFEGLTERSVELQVILPLLGEVKWNYKDPTQVYLQMPSPAPYKVDIALLIDGESRVLVEAKEWKHNLNDEDEEQLKGYCLAARPKKGQGLAVLTNGKNWRLYIAPRAKNAKLQQFLEFDITEVEPKVVDKCLTDFLHRDKMSDTQALNQIITRAKVLYQDKQANATVMKGLTDAWNKLSTDEQELSDVVAHLADRHEIRPTEGQVKQFLAAKMPSVNKVADSPAFKKKRKKPGTKPASFTCFSGSEQINEPVKSWRGVLFRVCELVYERRPNDYRKFLEMNGFSESADSLKFPNPIGKTGIYVNLNVNAQTVKKACPEVLAKFEFQANSFAVTEK